MSKLILCLLVATLIGTATFADEREVIVGPDSDYSFMDVVSHNRTTKIKTGDSVKWVWETGYHTTTSLDGYWDAEIWFDNPEFSYTFNTPGVYEYVCTPHIFLDMVGTVIVHAPGDVNGDGCADDTDLSMVLEAFGLDGNRDEDLNGDGIVDDADLAEVLTYFGTGC